MRSYSNSPSKKQLIYCQREDAIQQIIDTWLSEPRTTSDFVGGFAGVDSRQGRIILNIAHSCNQQSRDKLLELGVSLGSDFDVESLRVELFSREVKINWQKAEQILMIAREEAAKTSPAVSAKNQPAAEV